VTWKVVVQVAWPFLSSATGSPASLPSTRNWTVPAGPCSPPVPRGTTVAVNVTGSLIWVGFLGSSRVVRVAPARIFWVARKRSANPGSPVIVTSKTQSAFRVLSVTTAQNLWAASTARGFATGSFGTTHGGISGGQLATVT